MDTRKVTIRFVVNEEGYGGNVTMMAIDIVDCLISNNLIISGDVVKEDEDERHNSNRNNAQKIRSD